MVSRTTQKDTKKDPGPIGTPENPLGTARPMTEEDIEEAKQVQAAGLAKAKANIKARAQVDQSAESVPEAEGTGTEAAAALAFPGAMDPKTGKVDLKKVPGFAHMGAGAAYRNRFTNPFGMGSFVESLGDKRGKNLTRIEKLQLAMDDQAIRKAQKDVYIGMVPVVGTMYHWDKMNTKWRAASVATDVVDLSIPFIPFKTLSGVVRGSKVVKAEKNVDAVVSNMTTDVGVFDTQFRKNLVTHAENVKNYGKDYAKLRQLEDMELGLGTSKPLGTKTLETQISKAKDAAASSKTKLNDSADAVERELKDMNLQGDGIFTGGEMKSVSDSFDGLAVDHIRTIERAVDGSFDASPGLSRAQKDLAGATKDLAGTGAAAKLTHVEGDAFYLERLTTKVNELKNSLKQMDSQLVKEGEDIQGVIARQNRKAAKAYLDGNITSARAAQLDASDAGARQLQFTVGEVRELDAAAQSVAATIRSLSESGIPGADKLLADLVAEYNDLAARRARAFKNLRSYAEADPQGFKGLGGGGDTPSGGTRTPTKPKTPIKGADLDAQVKQIIKNPPAFSSAAVGLGLADGTQPKAIVDTAEKPTTVVQKPVPAGPMTEEDIEGPKPKPETTTKPAPTTTTKPATTPSTTPTKPSTTPTKPKPATTTKPATTPSTTPSKPKPSTTPSKPKPATRPKPTRTKPTTGGVIPKRKPAAKSKATPTGGIIPKEKPAPKPRPSPGPRPRPRPPTPRPATATGAPRAPGQAVARTSSVPKGKGSFKLPDGRKLQPGVFPEVVQYDQGFTRVTQNLSTGRRSFKKLARPSTERPRDTLKVLSTSERPPRERDFTQGLMMGRITPRSLTFTRRRGI